MDLYHDVTDDRHIPHFPKRKAKIEVVRQPKEAADLSNTNTVYDGSQPECGRI